MVCLRSLGHFRYNQSDVVRENNARKVKTHPQAATEPNDQQAERLVDYHAERLPKTLKAS